MRVGLTFEEIGRKRRQDPYDAVLDMLLEAEGDMNHMMWTSRSFRDEDISMALRQDECAVISDTLALAPDGCLKHHIGSLSGYGWAARFLQYYVRDKKVLTVAESIRRLTALPASRLGVADRGRIAPGMWADIAVFDAKQIASHCTVEQPRAYATGIAQAPSTWLLTGLRDGAEPGRRTR